MLKLNIELKSKVEFLITLFVNAIMGADERKGVTINEAINDEYITEKFTKLVTDIDNIPLIRAIDYLGGNGTICEVLSNMPGSPEEKENVIIERIIRKR